MDKMPKWADVALIPFLNLLIAFVLSGLVIFAIGENPFKALMTMIDGAFGSTYGWGYTLYYTTNFIFTGLAVSIAFKAAMFNIGGEGQAMIGGLGVGLACLFIPSVLMPHWSIALIFAMIAGGLFGAGWALIPAYLQAKRGSHVVITTIMFNFIATALMGYLLIKPLKLKGAQESASASFPDVTNLPTLHELLAPLGISFSKSAPANVSLFVALAMCVVVYLLMNRSRLGYEIRAFGESPTASVYAGISPTKIIIVAMMLSGAISGLMAINATMGQHERLILNAVEGAGFIGIAVALMGRNHPFGVLLAALLFGFLYQGGSELSLWSKIPRELIVVIQGLVILFTGALDNMVRMPVERMFIAAAKRKDA
ncbi:ABC transporter permease [uncultured Aliiroseovarius sp.]|uniref:ABC transporter permease n=1 Tax=uncultured Aliiroseovarius sp. TaxID=1658783 RepID=UPI0026225F6E|nr:ABC transporter permease [uncultured Aliiroseovarius sp.]